MHRLQVMTALAVAKEALQRKEATSPRALAKAAERQGRALFLVPEVMFCAAAWSCIVFLNSLIRRLQFCVVAGHRAAHVQHAM